MWLPSVLRHAERPARPSRAPSRGVCRRGGTLASLQEQGLAVRRAFMASAPVRTDDHLAAMRDEVSFGWQPLRD